MGNKCEWVKTDRVGCSEPMGGVGMAVPYTFCVLLQHITLILMNNFITQGQRWGTGSALSHWEMDWGAGSAAFFSLLAFVSLMVGVGEDDPELSGCWY